MRFKKGDLVKDRISDEYPDASFGIGIVVDVIKENLVVYFPKGKRKHWVDAWTLVKLTGTNG